MLSEGALRKEYESYEWENLALKRTIEDFEDQQKICRKRNEFRKMEVDMQKKIQAQAAKLRMSVGNLLESPRHQSWKRLLRYKVVNYVKPRLACQLPQRRFNPPLRYPNNSSISPVKECEDALFIERMTKK